MEGPATEATPALTKVGGSEQAAHTPVIARSPEKEAPRNALHGLKNATGPSRKRISTKNPRLRGPSRKLPDETTTSPRMELLEGTWEMVGKVRNECSACEKFSQTSGGWPGV